MADTDDASRPARADDFPPPTARGGGAGVTTTLAQPDRGDRHAARAFRHTAPPPLSIRKLSGTPGAINRTVLSQRLMRSGLILSSAELNALQHRFVSRLQAGEVCL